MSVAVLDSLNYVLHVWKTNWMIRNSVRIFGLVILRKQVECLERSHNKDSDCSDDNNKVFFHLE